MLSISRPAAFEERLTPLLRERIGLGSIATEVGPAKAVTLQHPQIDATGQVLRDAAQLAIALRDPPEFSHSR